MDEPKSHQPTDDAPGFEPEGDLPPGNHPIEVAARAGMGPLSPLGQSVWHGDAVPCVSCGDLVRRSQDECHHCGQDLSHAMIEKMAAHAGPWYVREHVRPFPGVTLERIVRQIRRGLLTETSIVRGPATNHQWRFAVETPGLCCCFGRCWSCHETIAERDSSCPHCHAALSFEQPKPLANTDKPHPAQPATAHPQAREAGARPQSTAAPVSHQRVGRVTDGSDPPALVSPAQSAPALEALSAIVGEVDLPARELERDAAPRVGRLPTSLIACALLFVVVTALMLVSQCRTTHVTASSAAPVDMVAPTDNAGS